MHKLILLGAIMFVPSCVTYTVAKRQLRGQLHKPKMFVKNTRSGTYQCMWYFGREYCSLSWGE